VHAGISPTNRKRHRKFSEEQIYKLIEEMFKSYLVLKLYQNRKILYMPQEKLPENSVI